MSANHEEDFVNQEEEEAEEVDLPEHDHSLGTGRSYECVFCKRGFNTAQALGGHMNIHRKDRARNSKPSNFNNHNTSIIDQDNIYGSGANPIFHSQIMIGPNYQPPHFVATCDHDRQPQFHHRLSSHLPPSARSPPRQPFSPIHHYNHQLFNPFGFVSFSMPCGSSSAQAEDVEKSRRGVCSQEEELDLELRLGGP